MELGVNASEDDGGVERELGGGEQQQGGETRRGRRGKTNCAASAAVNIRVKESKKAYLKGNQLGNLKRCQTLSRGESDMERMRTHMRAAMAARRPDRYGLEEEIDYCQQRHYGAAENIW